MEDISREELIQEYNQLKEELEIQKWGLGKTNEAIKVLYKELEYKNKELQKLDQLKSDFINTVSHELRTPLTTIREVASQILEGILGPTTPEQREFLTICLEDVDRLKRIIDDLLDISKLEAGKVKIRRELIDIARLAKGAIAAFSPKAKSLNLELRGKFPQEKAMVYADKDNIIRVFTNLIGNALKFTEKGCAEISISDKEQCIECSVSDTGKGISEEDLPKVFSKFQQFGRKDGGGEKGTGLGLSISKNIIDLHHGKIWVESTLNSGTTFTFTLPKYNERQICREYVSDGLKEADKDNVSVSILVFGIRYFDAAHKKLGAERINLVIQEFKNLVKQNVRQDDSVIQSFFAVVALLLEKEKAQASVVGERTLKALREYVSNEKLGNELDIVYKVISYPEEGDKKEIFAALEEMSVV